MPGPPRSNTMFGTHGHVTPHDLPALYSRPLPTHHRMMIRARTATCHRFQLVISLHCTVHTVRTLPACERLRTAMHYA
jgi:hypothetical protein